MVVPIKKRLVIADGTNPYRNLALENRLLDLVGEDELFLYLWKNEETVVIGRNQNVWSVCKPERMKEESVLLARRYSGGGAVYHDLGNLNFSFIARRGHYDLQRQYGIVLESLERLGVRAQLSGRNDIVLPGGDRDVPRKCSGSAYREVGDRMCHHGTILVNSDIGRLETYLAVGWEKIRSKGVESISAAVANLSACVRGITTDSVADALVASFERSYGGKPEPFSPSELASEDVEREAEFLCSHDWLYGRLSDFDCAVGARFPWGEIKIFLCVSNGVIEEAQVFSDALDTNFIGRIPALLRQCALSGEAIARTFDGADCVETGWRDMLYDIRDLLLASI